MGKSKSPVIDQITRAYLTVDTRILGLFRIYFGAVLLYDLLRRAPFLTLLYSNDGVLPNHYALFAPQAQPQLSIYFAFSTPAEVAVAFTLTAVVYLLYLLGGFTRGMQLLALVCVTSLNTRNLFLEDGGCATTNILAVTTAFLPLGERYSLDALWRGHRQKLDPTTPERPAQTQVVSLWMLVVTLEVAAIYLFNTVHKTGSTWRHGEAVHWVLWQNRVATGLAAWLRMHEPSWFSPLTTWGTLVVEAAMPVLVLLPTERRRARTAALLLAMGLHLGIAAMMVLGPFSYAMIGLVFLLSPSENIDWVAARLARWGKRTGRSWAKFLAAALAPSPALRPRSVEARPRGLRWYARETAALLVLLALGIQLTQDNPAVPRWMRLGQPSALAAIIDYPRLIQRWMMFAPNAPTDDGMLVVDGVTADGRHLDPFTGEAPDFEAGLRSPVPHGAPLCDYLFSIQMDSNERYRAPLVNYLDRWHKVAGRPEQDRLVSFEIYWVGHQSPTPGSTEPSGLTRRLVMSSAR